jgi:hypothetical protein
MNLAELGSRLTSEERAQLEALAARARADAERGTVSAELEQLLRDVFLRLGEVPRPGPLVGQFWAQHGAARPGREKRPRAAGVDPDALAARLPYPLGGRVRQLREAFARRRQGEGSPRLAYDLCAAAGLLVRFDAAIAIAAYVRDTGASDATLNHIVVGKLRAPSDGTWLEVAGRLAGALAGDERSPLGRRLADALGAKVAGAKESTAREELERLVARRSPTRP